MNSNILAVDVDEVCLQWNNSFIEWLISHKGFKRKHYAHESYDIHLILGVPEGQGRNLIEEFGRTEYFSELLPYQDALNIIPKFKQAGYSIIAITAAENSDIVKSYRQKNLVKYYGDIFDDIIHTGLGSSKLEALSKLPKKSIWVDDHPKHTLSGVECGHITYLIDRHHNREFITPIEIKRVSTWDDIATQHSIT